MKLFKAPSLLAALSLNLTLLAASTFAYELGYPEKRGAHFWLYKTNGYGTYCDCL